MFGIVKKAGKIDNPDVWLQFKKKSGKFHEFRSNIESFSSGM